MTDPTLVSPSWSIFTIRACRAKAQRLHRGLLALSLGPRIGVSAFLKPQESRSVVFWISVSLRTNS